MHWHHREKHLGARGCIVVARAIARSCADRIDRTGFAGKEQGSK